MARHPGIEVRHRKACRSRDGGRCTCRKSYRAWAFSAEDGRKLHRTFSNLDEAKTWRAHVQTQLRAGTLRAPTALTVAEAAETLIAGMRDGTIRNRKGESYKPSAVRSYERALRLRVLPALGQRRLSDVRRRDVQDFIDGLLASGLDGSTVRNTLDPLRVIFRRAIAREDVALDPMTGLEVPASRAGGSASPTARRPPRCLRPSPSRIARCGGWRCTAGSGAASCARCAGATSTWTRA
jgi:integrase